ncbi:PREDICTED: protein downstream neighbor of son homolog [Fragaria vesca subsp. vesca]
MNAVEIMDESPAPLLGSTKESDNGIKKPELSRNPRYHDIRMDEVYPAKKCRSRMLFGKENIKESTSMDPPISLKNLSACTSVASKRKHQQMGPEIAAVNTEKGVAKAGQANENSQSTFSSVNEISSAGDRSSGFGSVDVGKAMKGMAALESSIATGLPANSSGRCRDPSSTGFGSFCLPGVKVPLDFTLKTSIRVVSSSPASRIHKSITRSAFPSMPNSTSRFESFDDQIMSRSSGLTSTSEVSSKLLHSWVYPQSTLPHSLIQVLTSSTAEGVEMDFLTKRHVAWEDSFQSLYYMLRNGACNIFYVCTPYFVVMFTGRDVAVGTKRLTNACISQSTRVLQSLLRENDVSFSMPLCRSKVEQVTTEVLDELSEMQELGQTRRTRSLVDLDYTPESLLVISGNKNVHGLFDILLNYRSFMTTLIGVDVPALYSPVPFQNAAICSPQVKCMDLKRTEHGLCSSVEIKDAFIPPWIISSLCAVVGSEGGSFEASFTSDPTSIGLNVTIEAAPEKSNSQEGAAEDFQSSSSAFGIPESIVTPNLRLGLLKSLKFSNGSYTASVSPTLDSK